MSRTFFDKIFSIPRKFASLPMHWRLLIGSQFVFTTFLVTKRVEMMNRLKEEGDGNPAIDDILKPGLHAIPPSKVEAVRARLLREQERKERLERLGHEQAERAASYEKSRTNLDRFKKAAANE